MEIKAEIRSIRDYTDEWDSYLVFIVDGKAMPYLYIPDQFDDKVIAAILAKVNQTKEENIQGKS